MADRFNQDAKQTCIKTRTSIQVHQAAANGEKGPRRQASAFAYCLTQLAMTEALDEVVRIHLCCAIHHENRQRQKRAGSGQYIAMICSCLTCRPTEERTKILSERRLWEVENIPGEVKQLQKPKRWQ